MRVMIRHRACVPCEKGGSGVCIARWREGMKSLLCGKNHPSLILPLITHYLHSQPVSDHPGGPFACDFLRGLLNLNDVFDKSK
jgi:hypothetical protein